jgi:hypothetical protein
MSQQSIHFIDEVDDNLYMTLPEGTDASAIFAGLNKAISGLNQPGYEDLQ